MSLKTKLLEYGIVLISVLGITLGYTHFNKKILTSEDIFAAHQNAIVVVYSTLPDIIVPGLPPKEQGGSGTGFFISENEILTNEHVVDNAKKIEIKFDDSDKLYEVKVISTDANADLSILQAVDKDAFKNRTIVPLKLDESRNVNIGEKVIAIGHPLGLTFSITEGIISNNARRMSDHPAYFYQTDTQILPGNSGGPLFNLQGEVVGINEFIFTQVGVVGFSMTSDHVLKFLRDFKANRKIQSAILGIQLETNSINGKVESIFNGGAAAEAGIQSKDIIKKIYTKYAPKGVETTDIALLKNELSLLSVGDLITLDIIRNDLNITLTFEPKWKDWIKVVAHG